MGNEQYKPERDKAAEQALRPERNKPEPLYDKTNRNFQRQNQAPEQDVRVGFKITGKPGEGSSSKEEKDII